LDISTSTRTFSDDSHYRIDIASVELASIMEELIDEDNKRKITINRAIETMVGSAYCDFEKLKDMVQSEYANSNTLGDTSSRI